MFNNRIDWSDLILAIIFFIAAFFVFVNPLGTLEVITITIGIIIVAHGILQIINYFRFRGSDVAKSMLWSSLIIGIIEVVFGVLVLANPLLSQTVLTIVFVIWFLSIFIRGLLRLGFLKAISNTLFWIALILNILGIIMAFFIISNPLSAVLTLPTLIGILFVIAGVTSLFNAFDGH